MVAAPGAEVHVLDVTPKGRSRDALEHRSATPEGVIRHVRLRGTDHRIISAYAQLTGARAIVVDRDYGTSALWRNPAVVARMGRLSPVPVLALPSAGPALDRWAAGRVHRVLTAVDSTVASAVALRTSIGFAARHGARLTMLHALERFPGHSAFSGGEAWRLFRQLPAQQRQIARRLESRARRLGHADAAAHVITGDAALGIVIAAAETDADLIVMGVAPRTWLDRTAFGSTLGRVLRRAEMPVLVIPVAGGDEEWREPTVAAGVMQGAHAQFSRARLAA
jgi:nucleotide-binding universal stress UspA family protein